MDAAITAKALRDRWRGYVIGVGTLVLMFLAGMSVYRNIDLSIYTDLPEAFRSLIGITEDTDVGGLAYGAIYSTYGIMILAGLSISMGAAAVAREERDGTIGLLLANPRSRSHVLVSKTVSLVVLTAAGALAMWGGGLLAPELLDVDVSNLHVGALVLHMFINALFYGFMALAIGAWTGKNGLASGITAGVMVVSFLAVGLLPLVGGLDDVARAFPWYYYDNGDPVRNGIDWGGLAVLGAGIALFAVLAGVGVNRRDLRDGREGRTLLDRLRANPRTRKIFDRLAGSTRVSRIWVKAASDHQGLLVVVAYILLILGVMLGPMYNAIDSALADFADSFPEEILAIAGGGDISTPEGWYQLEHFGLMVPVAVMVLTITIGARALAGEEAQRTIGLLLANPVPRRTVLLEKTIAMVVMGVGVGVATFISVALGSVVAGLGMDMGNVAAASLLATLLGLAFGALALALGAGTGRVRVAVFGAVGVAAASHIINSFLIINQDVAAWARWLPTHYYLGSDPLVNGMDWGHGAVLAAITLALLGLALTLFERRDLRQG